MWYRWQRLFYHHEWRWRPATYHSCARRDPGSPFGGSSDLSCQSLEHSEFGFSFSSFEFAHGCVALVRSTWLVALVSISCCLYNNDNNNRHGLHRRLGFQHDRQELECHSRLLKRVVLALHHIKGSFHSYLWCSLMLVVCLLLWLMFEVADTSGMPTYSMFAWSCLQLHVVMTSAVSGLEG